MIFKNWTCERIFLVVAMVVGSILIFLTPPMCTPDENCHFLNSYAFSTGEFVPEVKDGKIGKNIRNDIINFVDGYNGKYTSNYEEKYSFKEMYFNSHLQVSDRSMSFYESRLLNSNPFTYVFSTAGILIGKVLLRLWGGDFDTPYNLLIFAKIGNYTFFLLAGYMSLKNAVCMKKSMLLLLTMPMSLYLGASVSYDAILIAGSIWFFSIFMKLYLAPADYIISKTDIIQTLTCVFVLISVKQVMIPFLLLLFLIEKNKFGETKKYVFCIVAVIVLGIVCYLMPTIVNGIYVSGIQTEYQINSLKQKDYVINNPLSFITILFRTIKEYRIFYLQGFYGSLGLQDTNFPVPIAIVSLTGLFVVSLYEMCKVQKIKLGCRILCFIAVVISILGMYYETYIGWTANIAGIGENIITGVQGRYFIPIFIFVFIIFMNEKIKKKVENESAGAERIANCIVENFILISTIWTLLLILLRYWG